MNFYILSNPNAVISNQFNDIDDNYDIGIKDSIFFRLIINFICCYCFKNFYLYSSNSYSFTECESSSNEIIRQIKLKDFIKNYKFFLNDKFNIKTSINNYYNRLSYYQPIERFYKLNFNYLDLNLFDIHFKSKLMYHKCNFFDNNRSIMYFDINKNTYVIKKWENDDKQIIVKFLLKLLTKKWDELNLDEKNNWIQDLSNYCTPYKQNNTLYITMKMKNDEMLFLFNNKTLNFEKVFLLNYKTFIKQ